MCQIDLNVFVICPLCPKNMYTYIFKILLILSSRITYKETKEALHRTWPILLYQSNVSAHKERNYNGLDWPT